MAVIHVPSTKSKITFSYVTFKWSLVRRPRKAALRRSKLAPDCRERDTTEKTKYNVISSHGSEA